LTLIELPRQAKKGCGLINSSLGLSEDGLDKITSV